MDVPWPPYYAPEGDPFNSAHVLPCHTMVVAAPAEAPYGTCFTLIILCSLLLAFQPAYETLTVPFSGIAGIAC